MKRETLKISDFTVAENWGPSVQLRWLETNEYCSVNDEFKKVLQQLFTSNLGNREWREITIVRE